MNSPHLGYWHDFGHSQIKENLGFSITPSGCAQSVHVRLAAMCTTASGLREIINRLLPEGSILRNLFRSFLQTAYLSGR